MTSNFPITLASIYLTVLMAMLMCYVVAKAYILVLEWL